MKTIRYKFKPVNIRYEYVACMNGDEGADSVYDQLFDLIVRQEQTTISGVEMKGNKF